MKDDDGKQSLIQDIKECGFFNSVPEQKIQELLPFFAKTSVNAGAILFYQSEPSDYFYVLLSGKLESYLIKSSGQSETLGVINPGESVGELGAMSGELRSLTVEAITKSELLRLPSSTFRDICTEYPSVLADIAKFIVNRSLLTIRLMAKEKGRLNIAVIMVLFHHDIKAWIDKLVRHLSAHGNAIIETDVKNLRQQIKHYEHAGVEDKKIFFFYDDWDEEFFKQYKGKIDLYLVFKEGERKLPHSLIDKINDSLTKLRNLRLELILLHEDYATIANTKKWLDLSRFDLHHHVRMNKVDDYLRLARFMTGNAYTLVLGGGGGKGLTHLGVIKAIIDKNIRIDAIAGASVGAGIGACYAFTLNYERTCILVDKLKKAGMQSLSLNHLTWPIISLFSSNPGTQVTYDIFRNFTIEDLPIPFFVVSSNLTEKTEFTHSEGLIWEAIRSTIAIPGVFPPVVLNGQLHYDGGLLNNLPVDIMRRRIGTENKIIAVSLSRVRGEFEYYRFPPVVRIRDVAFSRFRKQHFRFPSFFQTFLDSLLLGSSAKETINAKEADILVKPNLTGFKTLSVPVKREKEMIQKGYEDALTAIDNYLSGHSVLK